MPMTPRQRREYKAFLKGRRAVRKAWNITGDTGPKRHFGDYLRKWMGWK